MKFGGERMSEIIRMGVTTRWSDAVVYGGTTYFVEVPDDPELSPTEQIQQTFRQVESRLESVGSCLERLLQVTIILPFPEDLPTFNALWDAWIPKGCAPVRACLHAGLVSPRYRVELMVVAAVGTDYPLHSAELQ